MLSKEQIKNYSKYYQHRLFSSEQEARLEFARSLRRDNDQYGDIFGRLSEEEILDMSKSVPVYKLKKHYKIGVRVRSRSRSFSWKNVEINKTYLYELEGLVDTMRDRLGPIKMVRISSIYPNETHSKTSHGINRVWDLAQYLKNDGDPKMKAIVIEDTGGVVDGHHRLDAAILLNQKMIPAQMLKRSE